MTLELVVMTRLSKFGHFSLAFFSETKSVTLQARNETISMWEDFRANVLKDLTRSLQSLSFSLSGEF